MEAFQGGLQSDWTEPSWFCCGGSISETRSLLFCHHPQRGILSSPAHVHVWLPSFLEFFRNSIGIELRVRESLPFSNLPVFNMVAHLCPQVRISPYFVSSLSFLSHKPSSYLDLFSLYLPPLNH